MRCIKERMTLVTSTSTLPIWQVQRAGHHSIYHWQYDYLLGGRQRVSCSDGHEAHYSEPIAGIAPGPAEHYRTGDLISFQPYSFCAWRVM